MALNFFIGIFAFLLIFIVVYSLLKKTGVLGGNEPVMLIVSFLLAIFFVTEASLIEFVKVSSSWISVVLIVIFFIILLIGFLPGKEPLKFLEKGWVAWVVIGVILAVFFFVSIYVFNWAVSWNYIDNFLGNDWIGFVILLVVALIVGIALIRKK